MALGIEQIPGVVAEFMGKRWATSLSVARFDDDGAVELAADIKIGIAKSTIRMVLPRHIAMALYEALGRALLGP